VLFDTVSLLKSALSDEEYRWLKQSATVAQSWRGAMALAGMLEDVFLSGGRAPAQSPTDAAVRQQWHTRYMAALERLRQAGIKTIDDPTAGFETYLSLRERWEGDISKLRGAMMYEADEIDEPTYCPGVLETRRPFELRLRDV